MAIQFYFEDVDEIKIPKRKLSKWMRLCIESNKKSLSQINCIFCSDEYLKDINIKYLNHDYYTDIITFDYNESLEISGDIYISLDRVSDNAEQFNVEFNAELRRVLIHGVLHLLGNEDTDPKLKKKMHELEDFWLTKFDEIE